VVVGHLAHALLQRPREGERSGPRAPEDDAIFVDGVEVVLFVDRFVREMDERTRSEFDLGIVYVEHVAPMRSGRLRRFSRLPPEHQAEVLARMEAAREGVLRGGFAALKSLVLMGYYGDPTTWPSIGYDGPTIERRAPEPDSAPEPKDAPERAATAQPTAPPAKRALPLAYAESSVEEGRLATADLVVAVDVVVVGGGAGGAMVAREVARGGASVLLLEE
jgi:hypothetical protein